jgi:hypothetical protein
MDKDVTTEITEVIDTLRHAEAQARRMLQTARGHQLSFGLSCNYINDDIAQTLSKLRYMLRLAERADDKRPVEATRYDSRVIDARQRSTLEDRSVS